MDCLPVDQESRAFCACVGALAAVAARTADDASTIVLGEAIKRVSKGEAERLKWDSLQPSVAALQSLWRDAFTRQGEDVQAALTGAEQAWPSEAMSRADVVAYITGRVNRALGGYTVDNRAVNRVILRACDAAINTIGKGLYGLEFSLQDIGAMKFAADRAAYLVDEVDRATKAEIKAIIERGLSDGWSYDRTAKAIIARFPSYAVGRPQAHIASRAHLISVTENAFAYEQSHLAMARDLVAAGIPMVKAWETSVDERDCDDCQSNAGDGPIAIDASFETGDEAPPAHPACRCWMETYIDPNADVPDLDALLAAL